MFYNTIIEIDEKDKRGDKIRYYDLDNKSLEDIKKYIIYPFLKKDRIFIDGRYISASKIEMVKVLEAYQNTSILCDRAQSNVPPGFLVVYTQTDILNDDEYTTDITKVVLSEAANEIALNEKEIIEESIKNTTEAQNSVFIVHGRDDLAKTEVARFIEQLGITAIILHEQKNSGNTIIEKIEEHSNVAYGIILYTPCDHGSLITEEKTKPRARQNVVFEHGYLIGKLGRNKVAALVKNDVEIPGDLSGLVYIEFDKAGGWKLVIAKELLHAGFKIDFNKILK